MLGGTSYRNYFSVELSVSGNALFSLLEDIYVHIILVEYSRLL